MMELGQNKLDHSEFDTFREFYTKNWQKFVDYNIVDVELVDRLEDKLKLIDLTFTRAFDAKINFTDVAFHYMDDQSREKKKIDMADWIEDKFKFVEKEFEDLVKLTLNCNIEDARKFLKSKGSDRPVAIVKPEVKQRKTLNDEFLNNLIKLFGVYFKC